MDAHDQLGVGLVADLQDPPASTSRRGGGGVGLGLWPDITDVVSTAASCSSVRAFLRSVVVQFLGA